MNEINKITKKLISERKLSVDEYEKLILSYDDELADFFKNEAVRLRKEIYGNKVYVRGLIEISNICKNDCYYCGIRKSNKNCSRYRLSENEIFESCKNGYDIGFRTFVLQGGEDAYYTDECLISLIKKIKSSFPDCAITLSLGERSSDSYEALKKAGADRYLLRHETADKIHYEMLHPKSLSFNDRINALKALKDLGYQVGCGFMVGSPYQNTSSIAMDLKFIEEFQPDMCGIGPFIPHKDTPFKDKAQGNAELTCYLLSLIRIIKPNILLPATTALGTIDNDGREKGILSGANVVMPNLTPIVQREKYTLYNNKLSSGAEDGREIEKLMSRLEKIGYAVDFSKGDIIK